MDRFNFLALLMPVFTPVLRTVATGIVGAAAAYLVDRQFFDAQLANDLANSIIGHINAVLR